MVSELLPFKRIFQAFKVGWQYTPFPLQALLGSWGESERRALFPQHTSPLLRTWRLPFPSLSLFSTGLWCILMFWSQNGCRFDFSPTELMKGPFDTCLFRHHWTSSWASLRMLSIRWYINLGFNIIDTPDFLLGWLSHKRTSQTDPSLLLWHHIWPLVWILIFVGQAMVI